MIQTARFDFDIYQGGELAVWFDIVLPDGTIADPPTYGIGYTYAALDIRDKPASDGGVSVLDEPLTTDNGGIVLGLVTDADGVEHSGYWWASSADTALLVPWGDGWYDMELGEDPNKQKPFAGIARLIPEATLI